jgi:inward rectifier potassium channel
MHVLDERSPLHGYDAAQAIVANAQVFVAVEVHEPMLSTTVHDLRNYSASAICFGMRYADALTTTQDGTPVLDLTRIGALVPDAGDRPEQGWTEREEDG